MIELGLDREFEGYELNTCTKDELEQSKTLEELAQKTILMWADNNDLLYVRLGVEYEYKDGEEQPQYKVGAWSPEAAVALNEVEVFDDVYEAIAKFEEWAEEIITRFRILDECNAVSLAGGTL